MTKAELINKISSDEKYKSICRKLLKGNSLHKDLFQDLMITLLEYPSEKIDRLECPECFVYKILTNMVNSSTSRFHYKYRLSISKEELKGMQENYD